MSINTFDIQQGMDVFSSDGQKIGQVKEVLDSSGGATESGAQATGTADESSSNSSGGNDFGLRGIFTTDGGAGGGGSQSNHDATRDPVELREEFGTSAGATGTQANTDYFKVSEGGILGMGATDLFVPFSAVDTVAADGIVTLSCTKDEADGRFRDQPNGSGISDAPDMPIV